MKRLLLIALLLVCPPPVLAQQNMEIIALRHRSAEQLLPALRPLLEPGASLSGMNDKLVVRASARNRAEIRQALAALDTALRRLVITVRQDNDRAADAAGAGLSGSLGSERARVILPDEGGTGAGVEVRRGDDAVRARLYSTRGRAEERVSQQVQVVEGGQAYIRVGYAFPLPLRQVVAGPDGVIVSESVVYRDLGTGFYARPVVAGDEVTLEISPQQESLSATAPGAVHSQRLSTTLRARLGEWIVLGATDQEETRDRSGAARYSTRGSLEQRRVLLKVEELP